MNLDVFIEEIGKELDQDKYADMFLAVFERIYMEDVIGGGVPMEEAINRMADMSAYILRASVEDVLKRISKYVDTK